MQVRSRRRQSMIRSSASRNRSRRNGRCRSTNRSDRTAGQPDPGVNRGLRVPCLAVLPSEHQGLGFRRPIPVVLLFAGVSLASGRFRDVGRKAWRRATIQQLWPDRNHDRASTQSLHLNRSRQTRPPRRGCGQGWSPPAAWPGPAPDRAVGGVATGSQDS